MNCELYSLEYLYYTSTTYTIHMYNITRRHIRVERTCFFSFSYDLISSLKLYAYNVYTSVYTYRTALYRWRVRRKVTRNKIINYYVIVLPPPPPPTSTPTQSYMCRLIWYITIGITFEYNDSNNNNNNTHVRIIFALEVLLTNNLLNM